jgi:hypothetical protein
VPLLQQHLGRGHEGVHVTVHCRNSSNSTSNSSDVGNRNVADRDIVIAVGE